LCGEKTEERVVRWKVASLDKDRCESFGLGIKKEWGFNIAHVREETRKKVK